MKNKSFTLIEILVAVTIFSLIMGIASGVFISAIKAQRKTLAYRQLLDQTSYIMEYMSRALRMAKKDLSGDCLTTIGKKNNYETNGTKDRIRFINYQDKCQEFFLEDSQLKERKSIDDTAANFASSLPLTSDNLEVVSFKIGPSDSWDQNDNEQPRVTLFLNIKGTGEKPEQKPEIKIQTTISQRNPDIEK